MSTAESESDLPRITPPPDVAAMRANVDKVFGALLQKDPEKFCRWVIAVILEMPSPENPLHEHWTTEDERHPTLVHLRKRYRFLASSLLNDLDGVTFAESEECLSVRDAIEREMQRHLEIKYLYLRFPALECWNFSSLCWQFFEWAREPLDIALSRVAEWVAHGVPLFTRANDGRLAAIYDDDPRIIFLTESEKLGGLYPVNEPPSWMSDVFVRSEDMKIYHWIFNFNNTPSADEVAERRTAFRKHIQMPNSNLKMSAPPVRAIEPKVESELALSGTVLQTMLENGFPISDLHEAARDGRMSEYIAKLILKGDQIVQRSTEPWEFKSLAEWAEESFTTSGRVSWMWERGHAEISRAWAEGAQKEFADHCFVNSIYEEEEGLLFYVKEENGNFRETRAGDPPYDFLCRLRADGGVQGMGFIRPPSWAEELFLNKHNYDIYRMFWFELDSVERSEAKRLKRSAVLRETRRLNSGTHGERESTAETLQQKNASDFERGLAKLRILPRPLSYQMVDVVQLANEIAAAGNISIEEALGHIWQTTVHDESFFLYELGNGLPHDIGPAALNTDFIDRTSLNEREEDLAWLKMYAFTPADAQEILAALPKRSLAAIPEVSDDENGYLDPLHPRHAPKLAAAVRAWQAVKEPGKRTPKQAIEKWLRDHAAELGIADPDGKPVKLAVEEISKVANWKPAGGAQKMPDVPD